MQALGLKLNMDSLNKLTAPTTAKIRQLQKIVQDIKKNDGSIFDKLRRLKSKPVPRVPARDYRGEVRGEDDSSDPEYDNETYEAPGEDDSYEPPPSHHPRVFSAPPVPRGEYLDSCQTHPERPPKKPLRPEKAVKQLPPTPTPRPNHHHQHQQQNDEDYIDPDSCNDEDYVEPDANPPPHRGRALRELPKVPSVITQRSSSPECYEVPDKEVKSHTPPIVTRLCPVLLPQPHPLPPKPSPRLPSRLPTTVQEPTGDDEYEVCDADNSCNNNPPESRPLLRPKPLPRERSPKPALKPKLPAKSSQTESESRTLPVTQTEPPPASLKTLSFDLKRPKIPIPHFTSHKLTDRCQRDNTENGFTDQDMEAELRFKPWFGGFCDRKTADDALLQSNQDGSFLVRKSSGHDAQQPYTLVVFYNGRVYNIPIRYLPSTQQYALGRKKKGEEFFSSVSHIVEHHQRAPLVLIDCQSNNKDATRLTFPVRP